jgi:predicted metal-dependent HD superfamily phosphohydrolase
MTLETRWTNLWERLGGRGDSISAFNDLTARYSEPHRAYHTLAHIEHCLAEFDAVRPLAADPDAIELAVWYHDAVYDPKAADNEQRSAALAFDAIEHASLPASLARSVAELIVATKHRELPTDGDAQLLVDIDLSILGQSEERFDEYERQIRKEYERVPEEQFVAGRAKILQSFLDRPTIYATQFFREKYEAQARRI